MSYHLPTHPSARINHVGGYGVPVSDDVVVRQTCDLLGSWFGAIIQLILGAISFSALFYKWYREEPRRPFSIWIRDTSKQAIGAVLLHFWNIFLSNALSSNSNGMRSNPCTYYFLNFVLDTVLGCLLSWAILELWNNIAARSPQGQKYFTSGFYGNPPLFEIWAAQIGQWLLIITLAKFLVLWCVILPGNRHLYEAASWLLSPLDSYPKLMLTFVMILLPLVINSVVFWLQDQFLMDRLVSLSHAMSRAAERGYSEHEQHHIARESDYVEEQAYLHDRQNSSKMMHHLRTQATSMISAIWKKLPIIGSKSEDVDVDEIESFTARYAPSPVHANTATTTSSNQSNGSQAEDPNYPTFSSLKA